jgi:hypothetical protein
MRSLLIFLLVLTAAYANQAAADHTGPLPPELLSPTPHAREPIRVSRANRCADEMVDAAEGFRRQVLR